MSTLDLEGRVAIVTGASRGIGLAIGRSLVAAGARVVLTSRSQEAADEAAATLGERAVGFAAHAADEQAASACVEHTSSKLGSVDILVNNAGTNPAYGPAVEQDRARVTKVFDVNLWAPLLWTQLAWKGGMRERGGAIVNTASLGGIVAAEDLGVYHASKAALIHLTRHLALELGPQVRVNAVAPGVVRTRMAETVWREEEGRLEKATPLGRIGEPGDVGSAVAFLASDAADWITGETLVIDGGQGLGVRTASAAGDAGIAR